MSAWENTIFTVSAGGETPFVATKRATRCAENIAKDLPVEAQVVFLDAEFKRNYPGFIATLHGRVEEV